MTNCELSITVNFADDTEETWTVSQDTHVEACEKIKRIVRDTPAAYPDKVVTSYQFVLVGVS